MDMQSQMTRPYGHEQAEDPIKIHHPEEEEHQEKGASKVLKKVKEKAKKIKNSLTKHGHGHEHDDEDDDEEYEQDPEVHGAPVYESSAVRGGVTGQPESFTHPGENTVPAPEEIIPPGTKVFPVVTSDYTKPVEAEPLQEVSYGHEALSDPVRKTDKEERREAPTRRFGVSEFSDRGESREAHYEPINTATEDVTSTFSPGVDEYLGGQVNIERPKGLYEDPAAPGGGSGFLSSVSNYQSKVTDPTHEGGEAGIPEIAESLGRMKVTDESPDQKSGLGFGRDLPTRSHEFDQKNKSSPTSFGGEQGAELGKNHEFDKKTESAIGKDLQTGFSGELGVGLSEVFPARSSEFDQDIESGSDKNLPMEFGGKSGAGLGEDFQTRSREFDQKKETEIDKNSEIGLSSGSITGLGEDFPARSNELGLKNESGIGKESPTMGRSKGGQEENIPVRTDDVKVEDVLPTGTHDQFSPELSRPIERDDFDSKAKETTEETKPSTYPEKFASATSVITDKAIAAKNAVASKLGYTGESGENPVREETPGSTTGYGQKVAGTVVEKLTPVYEKVKETGANVLTKLPLSGGGKGGEATQEGEGKGLSAKDYMAEKLSPGQEDKALSEVIAEKLHLGGEKKTTTKTKEMEVTVEKIPTEEIPVELEHIEKVSEEGKEVGGGGGMVGKIKGWLGGTTPKSSDSVEESTQSLGSTVGTMGFSDSGGGGALPAQRGLQQSGN